MKKIISTFLLGSLFAFAPFMPEASASAVPVTFEVTEAEMDAFSEMVEASEYATAAIKPCPAGTYKVRRNTRTKKKIVNSLIAGGIGAAVGGGLGGGRGALLGAGTGAGGYLVYRYVRDRRGRCVPRYLRRG